MKSFLLNSFELSKIFIPIKELVNDILSSLLVFQHFIITIMGCAMYKTVIYTKKAPSAHIKPRKPSKPCYHQSIHPKPSLCRNYNNGSKRPKEILPDYPNYYSPEQQIYTSRSTGRVPRFMQHKLIQMQLSLSCIKPNSLQTKR